jgi:hypothetical protein
VRAVQREEVILVMRKAECGAAGRDVAARRLRSPERKQNDERALELCARRMLLVRAARALEVGEEVRK